MPDFKRRVKELLCLAGILAAAAVPYRLVTGALGDRLDPEHNTTFLKKRWEEFESQADQLRIKGNTVFVFFGLSDVELGIDPGEVLRLSGLRNAEAVNLGFRAIPADSIPVVLERAFRALRDRGAREIVLVMKVPIYSLTRQTRGYLRGYETDDFRLYVADAHSFFNGAMGTSLASLDLLLKKALLGTSSSSVLSYWLYQKLLPSLTSSTGAESPRRTITTDKAALGEGHWPLARRGKVPWELIADEHPGVLEAASEGKTRVAADAWFQNRFGTLNPSLDPEFYGKFRSSAEWARRYGVSTIVFSYSDFLSITRRRSAEGEASIVKLNRDAVDVFQAKFFDLDQEGLLENSDFLDILHLSGTGQTKIWQRLARRLHAI